MANQYISLTKTPPIREVLLHDARERALQRGLDAIFGGVREHDEQRAGP